MGSALNRFVQIQISNQTSDITLKNPRTYCRTGHCSVPPGPFLPPGSSDSCHFSSPRIWGCTGVLVYEAEPFTLAIYFCNPLNYTVFPMELGLELSLDKSHLGRLQDVHDHLSGRVPGTSHGNVACQRINLDTCQAPAQVSLGPVQVTATMSNARRATLRVVVAEWEGSGKENPHAGKHSRSSLVGSPKRVSLLD